LGSGSIPAVRQPGAPIVHLDGQQSTAFDGKSMYGLGFRALPFDDAHTRA
jgi:hypothetical protein